MILLSLSILALVCNIFLDLKLDIFSIFCLVVIFIMSIITNKLINNDLNLINKAIKSATDGDLKQKIELSDDNILSNLSENINQMLKSMYKRESQIKSYQEELRAKKENLEAIFDSSTDGIMTLSSDLKVISVNPTITKWVGLASEKIVGNPFNEFVKCNCHLKMSDIDCADPSVCPIAAYWPDEMPKEGFITNINTGKITYIALNCSPIHGLTKTTESFVAVLMDITQLKEVEKVKENFVATLTHDLRVPLLAENHTLKYLIKGSYGTLTDNQKIASENMLNSNEDLLKLVNTLLDVYKYESGSSLLYKEAVDIIKLINECITELTPLAIKNIHKIECLLESNNIVVNADKNELKRVFMNLIGNAISYTQENGHIQIFAEQNEDHIIVKVKDNGKGIAENDLKNIFDRYFSTSKKFRKVGTGLGLYLSKQIITAHGGKIWVESQQGHGSTFFFTLPINTEENQE